jgi:predicted nucleotidyltransferase
MNEKGMPVMKISIEQIKALLYKQKSLVFGSYARNEQTIESDLDIRTSALS